MNLKDVIRAPKENIEISDWKSGRISRSSFPQSLVKERWYRLGSSYSWRIVSFVAAGRNCKVLIILNESKEIFRARLGIEDQEDLVILCDHEWHAGEPGLHCHINRKEAEDTKPGQARQNTYKWPKRLVHGTFPISKESAFAHVAEIYGIVVRGSLL